MNLIQNVKVIKKIEKEKGEDICDNKRRKR